MILGYEDTYFFSSAEAQKIATQQNRSQNDQYLQVCYYDGAKIESDLPNLIHIPIDNLLEELASGRYRLPEKVNLDGFDLSASVKLEITRNFNISLVDVKKYRIQYNESYFEQLKNAKLDFTEPLRFYILANSRTEVMQYVAKSIAEALEALGYEVLFDLYYGIEDIHGVKKVSAFNPHATININHLNNSHLNPKCFNFVWYQDPMPRLYDDAALQIRDKDFIYSLVPEIDDLLQKKGLSLLRQNFCVNEKEFKLLEDIPREKKIVFIGSSYHKMIPDTKENLQAIEYLTDIFENGEALDKNLAKIVAKKFFINEDFIVTRLFPYLVRDKAVLWLCSLDIEYEIEVYGNGWDIYDSLRPFYKGSLKYGEDIAKVYNSAEYSFAPHQSYVLQQRVLEAAACGCESIVYDCLRSGTDKLYEESLRYFKTLNDLKDVCSKKRKEQVSFTKLLEENSYEHLAKRIINTINKRVIDE